ncbi:MAG TPA: hypothetical protein DCQ31_15100 [Bacteroidales bacterium]|nr:hypothetical protein [Bacteroidales bacterium]
MLKKIALIALLLVGFEIAGAQETDLVNWLTLEKAMELNKKEPRYLMIDVYTDWCGWCKHMSKTTFSNQQLANYINTNFYPIKFNAEGFDTVQWNGKTYVNKGVGKQPTHDLAIEWLDGQMSYPSIVYFDLNNKKYVVPGYKDIKAQETILYFFAERIHESSNFVNFEKYFKYTFSQAFKDDLAKIPAEHKFDTTGVVKWYTLAEALELNKKVPKKIFVDIYANWTITNKVMERTTYRHPEVADYLNTTFYPVRFDAQSTDSINFNGAMLNNPRQQHPFHLFTVNFAVTGDRIYFPTFVFIDEKNQAITKVQNYLSPKTMSSFLQFIGSEKYKTVPWETFVKEFISKIAEE